MDSLVNSTTNDTISSFTSTGRPTQSWIDEANSTAKLRNTTSSEVENDQTLAIVLPICGILFVILLVFILCRVKALRRMNSLRHRLVSLRRYDPTLKNGRSEQGTVQTPDNNDDPLLMFSLHDSKQKSQTSSTG